MIHRGDAFELIHQIEDESIDLLITDPPYGISRDDAKNAHGYGKNGLHFGEWDVGFDLKAWLKTIVNKPKKDTGQVIIFNSFHNIELISRFLEDNGYHVQDTPSYWFKTNPVPHYRERLPIAAVEQFIWATRGEDYVFNQNRYLEHNNGRYAASCHEAQRHRFHTTQKPLGLWLPLMKVHSNKGDLVLDTFGGSGTTAVAAERLGRDFIVIELDKTYYKLSTERLDKERKRSKTLWI